MTESFYDLLGVSEDASVDDIEAAYRRRLKETHPDVSDADDASERTRRLIEARDVLTDERERARYDRLGHDRYVAASGGPTADGTDGRAATSGWDATDGWDTTDAAESVRDDEDGDSEGGRERNSGGTSRRERRRRERRAAEAVGNERAGNESGADASTAADPGSATGSPGAGATSGTAGASAGATPSGATGVSPGGWNSRSSAVRETYGRSGGRDSVVPTGQALGILIATFVTYPVLLFSAVFPPFPLVANVVVGVCLLLLVGYLQSLPRVAIVAFGSWSVLGPLALEWLGIGILTLPGLLVVVGTWFPFGLSLLTWSVMRL